VQTICHCSTKSGAMIRRHCIDAQLGWKAINRIVSLWCHDVTWQFCNPRLWLVNPSSGPQVADRKDFSHKLLRAAT